MNFSILYFHIISLHLVVDFPYKTKSSSQRDVLPFLTSLYPFIIEKTPHHMVRGEPHRWTCKKKNGPKSSCRFNVEGGKTLNAKAKPDSFPSLLFDLINVDLCVEVTPKSQWRFHPKCFQKVHLKAVNWREIPTLCSPFWLKMIFYGFARAMLAPNIGWDLHHLAWSPLHIKKSKTSFYSYTISKTRNSKRQGVSKQNSCNTKKSCLKCL